MKSDDIELAKGYTVAKCRELIDNESRSELAKFIKARLNERYLNPVLDICPSHKHGFTQMAVACLLIETLQAFHEGKNNTKQGSKEAFHCFFTRVKSLKVFSDDAKNGWFYTNIRCGILHQGETRGGWRIRRGGKLLDESSKTINANKFLLCLRKEVNAYAARIEKDNKLRRKFCTKLDALCEVSAEAAT